MFQQKKTYTVLSVSRVAPTRLSSESRKICEQPIAINCFTAAKIARAMEIKNKAIMMISRKTTMNQKHPVEAKSVPAFRLVVCHHDSLAGSLHYK